MSARRTGWSWPAEPAWPGAEFSPIGHDESASSLLAASVGPRLFGRDPDGSVIKVLSRQ